MATQIDNTFRTFSFPAAISANTIVTAISGGDNTATALITGANAIGVVQEDVAANGVGSVKLFFPTQFGIVSGGPLTAGMDVFATTGGVLTGSLVAAAITVGLALQSGANGDVIEYAPKF